MSSPGIEDLQGTVIPEFEIDTMARCLLPALRAFYDSPEGQAEFERWKAEHNRSAE